MEIPIGLSEEFGTDRAKRAQWSAFLRKHRVEAPGLDIVLGELQTFLAEPMRLARTTEEETKFG